MKTRTLSGTAFRVYRRGQDYCMTNDYGVSRSPDLRAWSIEDDVIFPADARHGSVAPIRAGEAAGLLDQFGGGS